MRVRKISATSSTPFDLETFSKEPRELSDRYAIRLVTIGALSGLDASGNGTTFLAIWSDGDEGLRAERK
jgi:hypothetical protein